MGGSRRKAGTARAATARTATLLVALVMAVAASVGLPAAGVPVSTARAAAPPPPLDQCLAKGSFNIADPECQLRHAPTFGDQFGPIGSVVTHVAARGDTISLGFNPGDNVFYDRPISCGDAGCIYHGIFWRPQDDMIRANWMEQLDGCGGADETCQFRVWPDNDAGDTAEKWLVVYAQHYRGIFPQQGVANAIYVAPRFYPVRVDSVDRTGAPLRPRPGAPAYAVRAGRSPAAAACAVGQWWVQYRRVLNPPVPDCVLLGQATDPLTGAPGWAGDLPVDSGDWTIIAAPAGDAGSSLAGRPTPYRSQTVRPVGDDLRIQAMEVARPALRVTIVPEQNEMALGSSQTVEVIVAADGGEAGSLTLGFDDPGVLSVVPVEPPVLIPGDPDDTGTAAFTLAPGTARSFLVDVTAVSVGGLDVEAFVTGTDDVDRPVTGQASARISVVEGGEPGAGAEAIPPPVVDVAVAAAPGTSDAGRLEGTATGTPNGTVTVTVWTSPLADGACAPRTSGPGVQLVGSTEVTLGDDGSAPFVLAAPLTAGWFTYGLSSVGSQVSRVGDCTAVSSDMPTVSVADASVIEGTSPDEEMTQGSVMVSLSQPSDLPVSVRLSTADGTASAPDDHIALDGVDVVFAPGEVQATVSVDVVPDNVEEDDETLVVSLSDPGNARLPGPDDILRADATLTIADDDSAAIDATPDARGIWRWTYRLRQGGKTLVATYTMTIQRHDRETGKVTGRIVVDSWDPYPTYRGKVTGTITADRVDLKVTGTGQVDGPISGDLVRRKGNLAVRQDESGGKVTFVLMEPATDDE